MTKTSRIIVAFVGFGVAVASAFLFNYENGHNGFWKAVGTIIIAAVASTISAANLEDTGSTGFEWKPTGAEVAFAIAGFTLAMLCMVGNILQL